MTCARDKKDVPWTAREEKFSSRIHFFIKNVLHKFDEFVQIRPMKHDASNFYNALPYSFHFSF